ncbi:type-F conjugative transfer system protein TraW [Vibrio mimicus]|uniref:type-F conjugative transfer system protein TraW n=1 Tax=Vibrio mimicus TaxID=674 RepID=UPI0011D7CE0D|nr:type-F conjugative transfer system protein TraW [Vibrio mimicus]TXY44789.1 type-F conjugative transfer system protein TraW [Vibrio mimicus]
MKHRVMLSLFSLSLAFSGGVVAKDLGKVGATFPIGEMDMLTWIEQRLKDFEANGRLEQMQLTFQARVRRRVEHPTPLELTTTRTPEMFFVDPSQTLARDFTDAGGKVFAKAGARINPFDTRTWPEGQALPQFEYSHVLAFLDARDERQLAWAQNLTAAKPIKWILTGGSPNLVAKRLNTRIYFDQLGITQKLHIKAVPSLVEQSGIHWKVTEFDVSQIEVGSQ